MRFHFVFMPRPQIREAAIHRRGNSFERSAAGSLGVESTGLPAPEHAVLADLLYELVGSVLLWSTQTSRSLARWLTFGVLHACGRRARRALYPGVESSHCLNALLRKLNHSATKIFVIGTRLRFVYTAV